MLTSRNDRSTNEVGPEANYYGGLHVKKHNNCYYWAIEDYCGFSWEKIPKELYKQLLIFKENQDSRHRKMHKYLKEKRRKESEIRAKKTPRTTGKWTKKDT